MTTYQQDCERRPKERREDAAKATQRELNLALAFGCIDADRCNGHIQPEGSCDECIIRSIYVVKEMHAKGYRF